MELSPQQFAAVLDALRPERHEGPEARKEPRISVSGTTGVRVWDEPVGLRVGVRDISTEGLGLVCARQFAQGDRFIVSLPRRDRDDLLIVSEVRYGTPAAEGIYHVGVPFLDDGSGL